MKIQNRLNVILSLLVLNFILSSTIISNAQTTVNVIQQPSAVTVSPGNSYYIGGVYTTGSYSSLSYSWSSTPAGTYPNDSIISITPNVTTTYTLTVSSSDPNIVFSPSNTSTWIVYSGTPLVADAGTYFLTCLGEPLVLGGNPTALGGTPPYTYSWHHPGGIYPAGTTANQFSTIANPTVTLAVNTPHQYTVVVADANGMTATSTCMVHIAGDASSTVTAFSNQTLCPGQIANLTAIGVSGTPIDPFDSYQWSSIPTGFYSTDSAIYVSPSVTTTYIARYGCGLTDSVVITVDTSAISGLDTSYCQCSPPDSLTVCTAGGSFSINYSGTSPFNGNVFDPSVLPPGNYTITYTYGANTISQNINVYNSTVVDIPMSQDAYVSYYQPNSPHNNNQLQIAGGIPTYACHSLLKPDISTTYIPAGAYIYQADFIGKCQGITYNYLFLQTHFEMITSTWAESTITWNSFLATTGNITGFNVTSTPAWWYANYMTPLTTDLTTWTKQWHNGTTTNNGFVIKNSDQLTLNGFNIGSSNSLPPIKPKLRVCYHTGSIIPSALPSNVTIFSSMGTSIRQGASTILGVEPMPSGASYTWVDPYAELSNINDLYPTATPTGFPRTYTINITETNGITSTKSITITEETIDWVSHIQSTNANQGNRTVNDITADGDGNVYAIGTYDDFVSFDGPYSGNFSSLSSNLSSNNGFNGKQGIFIVKYDSNGILEWNTNIEAAGVNTDYHSLVIDSENDLWITGNYYENLNCEIDGNIEEFPCPDNSSQIYLGHILPNGEIERLEVFGEEDNDYSTDIEVSNEYVYITGYNGRDIVFPGGVNLAEPGIFVAQINKDFYTTWAITTFNSEDEILAPSIDEIDDVVYHNSIFDLMVIDNSGNILGATGNPNPTFGYSGIEYCAQTQLAFSFNNNDVYCFEIPQYDYNQVWDYPTDEIASIDGNALGCIVNQFNSIIFLENDGNNAYQEDIDFYLTVGSSLANNYSYGIVIAEDDKVYYSGSYTGAIGFNQVDLTSPSGTYNSYINRFDLSTYSSANKSNSAILEEDIINRGLNVKLMPNPTKGICNIMLDKDSGVVEVKIYGLDGKLVRNKTIQSMGPNTIRLDISSLNNGIYLVQVKTKLSTEYSKVILQK